MVTQFPKFSAWLLASLCAVALTASAATPQAGSQAPAFRLQDQDGNGNAQDYKGKWVALYFIPRTPRAWLHDAGLRIPQCLRLRQGRCSDPGNRVDDVESHKALPGASLPLLADPTGGDQALRRAQDPWA
jgi:hypothetical protein